MSKWNLWQSIDAALRLQRILFVSPFYLNHSNGKLKSCWIIKSYTALGNVSILMVLYFAVFHLGFMEVLYKIVPNQLTWKILCIYIISSLVFHFIWNMIIIAIKLKQQMQFLEQIESIDRQLWKKFHANVDHRKYKQRLSIATFAFYMYFVMDMTIEMGSIFVIADKDLMILPLTFALSILNISMSAQMYTSTNYLFLIERRYRLIICINNKSQTDYNRYVKRGIVDINFENVLLLRLLDMFKIFKDISQLIVTFDDFFGWIYANQLIKTFMISLAEIYFIFLVANDETVKATRNYLVYGFIAMVSAEMLKILINIITIHSIYAAVNIYNLN